MEIGDSVSVRGTTLIGKIVDIFDPFYVCNSDKEMFSVAIDRKDNKNELVIFELTSLKKVWDEYLKEVKDNKIEINGELVSLEDLCQVVTESDSIAGLITQRFDFIGSKQSCLDKISSTDIKPEKGSHFSIAVAKWWTTEKGDLINGTSTLR